MKVPEGATPHPREIEELFQPALLATKLNGKSFDPKKDHGDDTHYGKVAFAESVVRANASTVDFSDFEELMERIEAALRHHASILAVPVAPVAASPAIPATGSTKP